MAPSSDSQSRDQAVPLKRRRQNPISCCFCREKKLKCDRQSPCSNCSFRSLVCSNQAKFQPRNGPPLPDSSDHAAIVERLRRLEERALDQETLLTSGADRPRLARTDAPTASEGPWRSPATTIAPHIQHAPDRRWDTDSYETPASEYAEAVQSLEGAGLRRDPWLPADAVNTEVKVGTVQHIALLSSDPTLRELLLHKPVMACTLPSKEEAMFLLDFYSDHLEDLQHILHIPTVQRHLDICYTELARGQPVDVSVLVLLLSIFASASILMSHHPRDHPPSFSQSDGTRLSAYWAGCALDMIKYHHNMPCDKLEDIQATILLGHLLLNVEGFSARVHSSFTINVSRARDLALHKIDAARPWAPRDAINTEIERRVWWHIVTIDWVLSLSGGPQEGTYSVQPRQMAVNVPRNIDDKDLIYTNPPINRPLSEPTTMSFAIQRIKLGDLCREVVDLIPISICATSTVDYQQVIALDQRFEDFLQELPVFLRNDEQSIQQSEHVVARYPAMRIQRQLLSMLAKTKRCKMHHPFLIRGSTNPRYSYSRTTSLKSARAVLEEKRRIDLLHVNSHSHDRYKLGGYMTYHTFMATIVLVLDLCFNKKSSSDNDNGKNVDNDADTRVTKAEVMEACRSLHQDQSASGLGTDYLASLMDVLRKYKVKLRPPGIEHFRSNPTIRPNNTNTTNTPHQRPSLLARLPSSALANPTQNPTQGTSTAVPPTPPLQQPVTTSTNHNTNTGTVNPPSSSHLTLNLQSYNNVTSASDRWTAGSTTLADPQGCLADFDDIWNDYVELGPNLDMPGWDSLFSDLGPGMA